MGQLLALVLAGGLGTRLGRDKSILEINGEFIIEQHVKALIENNLEVYISCRPEQENQLKHFAPCIIDQHKEIGPIGGILSAYKHKEGNSWLVIACDMPNISSQSIRELISKRDQFYDVSCYINSEGYPEPLFAIWESSAYSVLESARQKKAFSLISILKTLNCQYLKSLPDEVFYNINTPEDLKNITK